MLAQFIAFIFNLITTFVGCLLVLRAYIFYQRISIFDPLSRLAWAATNWLVIPLSQIFRPTQRWEPASIIGAVVMALVVSLVAREVGGLPSELIMVPVCAVFIVIRWTMELILWGVLIFALLSWLKPTSPGYAMMWRLVNPILGPISDRMPKLGGIDISPVILFFIINAILYWVTPISQGYFVSGWIQ